MPVADTTVLVAVFDSSHPRHEEAHSLLEGVSVLHVPTVVLAELCVVLRRLAKDRGRNGNAYARKALDALMGKPEAHECQAHDGAEARRVWAKNSKLSYADAVTIVTAWELEDELVTFDDEQRKAWKREGA